MTRFIAAYDTEMLEPALRPVSEFARFMLNSTYRLHSLLWGVALKRKARPTASCWVTCLPLRSHPIPIPIRCCAIILFVAPRPPRRCGWRNCGRGKEWVERTFDRPCVGLRPGCGFANGLRGDPWLIESVMETGFQYVSSVLWGPETSLPALLEAPFTYAEDGFPELWELPGHGWHENLLKAHNLTDKVQRILAWPPAYPETIPARPVATPEEEFAIHRMFIDRAVDMGLPYVSLILHPWSLARFDPEMKMLELLFTHLQTHNIPTTTYQAEWKRTVRAGTAP